MNLTQNEIKHLINITALKQIAIQDSIKTHSCNTELKALLKKKLDEFEVIRIKLIDGLVLSQDVQSDSNEA